MLTKPEFGVRMDAFEAKMDSFEPSIVIALLARLAHVV